MKSTQNTDLLVLQRRHSFETPRRRTLLPPSGSESWEKWSESFPSSADLKKGPRFSGWRTGKSKLKLDSCVSVLHSFLLPFQPLRHPRAHSTTGKWPPWGILRFFRILASQKWQRRSTTSSLGGKARKERKSFNSVCPRLSIRLYVLCTEELRLSTNFLASVKPSKQVCVQYSPSDKYTNISI